MRRRDKPLDINKKLEIVRSVEDLIVDEDSNLERSKYFDVDFFKAPALSKKKLNIPICGVQNDEEYNNIVTADFVLPQSYVRHVKKIGDEEDVTIDYNADDQDMEWLEKHPKLANDPELKKVLTPEGLERVINILEKNTGIGEPVDMGTAERIVSQVLLWKPHISSRIFQDVYKYWLYKRGLIGKALCRRYWPQTANTDTDPHHVFRPREKERYRLRKHRKNDLTSFRKMQSLRREFGAARILLQLVVERELLKQAQLRVQEEIFQQRLFNTSPRGQESEPRCAEPFRHSLRFEHLLTPRESEVASMEEAAAEVAAEGGEGSSGLKIKLNMKGSQGAGADGAAPPRKRKSDGSRPRKRNHSAISQSQSGGGTDGQQEEEQGCVGADGTASASAGGSGGPKAGAARTGSTSAAIGAVATTGRPGLPQSPWPSFMDHLDTRENIRIPRSVNEYLSDLELQPFAENGTGGYSVPHRIRYRGRVGRGGRIVMDRVPVYRSRPAGESLGSSATSWLSKWTDDRRHSSAEGLRYVYPTHMASAQAQRFHIHSAELTSKFFVLPEAPEAPGGSNAPSLPPRPMSSPFDAPFIKPPRVGCSSEMDSILSFASQLSPANQKLMFGSAATDGVGGVGRGNSGEEMSKCPLLGPPERDAIASMVTPEEVDIYRMSDSEDEVVEVPRRPHSKGPALVVSNRQIVDRSAVKYSFKV